MDRFEMKYKWDRTTTVINIFGEPGSGKSTLASGIFYEMKSRGYDVELVSEYAKELVWEERNETFKNEIYLFAKQHHRLNRLKGKVKYIVTDRPLLMTKVFNNLSKEPVKALDNLVDEEVEKYDNFNIFITRNNDVNFESKGRNETSEEARIIKEKIMELGIMNMLTGDNNPHPNNKKLFDKDRNLAEGIVGYYEDLMMSLDDFDGEYSTYLIEKRFRQFI